MAAPGCCALQSPPPYWWRIISCAQHLVGTSLGEWPHGGVWGDTHTIVATEGLKALMYLGCQRAEIRGLAPHSRVKLFNSRDVRIGGLESSPHGIH